MEIQVHVSRPLSLLLIVTAAIGGVALLTSGEQASVLDGQGGEQPLQLAIHTAEDEMRRARLESELAERHIEVLTYELRRLEQEREIMSGELTEAQDEQFRQGLRNLVDLIEGKRRADDKMVESFRQMWDARRSAMAAAALSDDDPVIALRWPVQPEYGISAIFDDPEYEEYFGIPHRAVDIPALQSTPVVAAADGVIEEIVDNGKGYSYITVRHNGYATLYGHVSAFVAAEGQHIRAGETIALSGGMPGTEGAGHLTTGPHLHFELITGKGQINPLPYLPAAGVQLRK